MKKIVFMGTPDFSVPVLDALVESDYEVVLVVTQPDRKVGRQRKLTPPPVKKSAQEHGIPVFQPENISSDYEEILKYNPDVIVTAAYGQLLPTELLEQPPYRCINVHASLLPKLRGGAPIHYAILRGKEKTGISIMYMVEQLDAGDVLAQEQLPITETADVGTLHDQLSELGASLLLQTLPELFAESLTPMPQDESKVTYAPNITREIEKVNWHEPHTKVYNHIRGLRPWPVAYTTLNNDQMKLWWGDKDESTYSGEPGEIVKITDDSITVLCGNNRGIKLKEIQPAGRQRMTVADYLRGAQDRIQKGIILGD